MVALSLVTRSLQTDLGASACALPHFELLFIEFLKDAEGGMPFSLGS